MPSTSPLRFSVSTRLYFLPTVSRERAIAESTGEPLHSEADFYLKKKKKIFQKTPQTSHADLSVASDSQVPP